MTNRHSRSWRLLTEIGVVTLLVGYFLCARDMNAALASVLGLLIFTLRWLMLALRDTRKDRGSEDDTAAGQQPTKQPAK